MSEPKLTKAQAREQLIHALGTALTIGSWAGDGARRAATVIDWLDAYLSSQEAKYRAALSHMEPKA